VYRTLIFDNKGSIGILKFNRPDVLNALNKEMFLEIISVCREIREKDLVKIVILTGMGDRSFIAGTDINEMISLSSFEARKFAGLAFESINSIENLDIPTIAAINGFALGGGCELSMACDVRIASDKAKLGQPETNLGVIPGSGGTQRLTRLVGLSKAKWLIFSGEIINAKTALELGLVDFVVPHALLLDETMKLAVKISEKSKIALTLAKTAISKGFDVDLQTGLRFETECFAQCFQTYDQKEGMGAFMEKRKAVFNDK